jgi:serine phosphatase RsbU (regulator of sigma subunit)/anti-sigma regulatory factor (Ser/Thr protein kinase)
MIQSFMPHGTCFLWNFNVLALHVTSDAVIALAYFSIPAGLIWFARRRPDLPFRALFWMFGIFIVSCGLTHVMSIWVIWHPDYWLEGIVKAVTAVASITTAIVLIPILPQAVMLRSPKELEEANRELTGALQELARERHIANRLQSASLCGELPSIHGVRLSADYVPADSDISIGGDWYDAFRLADGRVAISIGDVTGHGLDSAVIMGKVRQSLRAAAYIQIDPSAMLDAADRALRAEYPDRIVTAFLAILDPVERSLTYAGAGHPWPLLRRPDGNIRELGESSLPLGLRDRNAPPAQTIVLETNDLIVFFTDGLVEATRDIEFGAALLRETVRNARLDAEDLARNIRTTVTNGTACRVNDDIAVLTMSIVSELSDNVYRREFDVNDQDAANGSREVLGSMLTARGASLDDVRVAETVLSELIGNVYRYANGPVEVVIDISDALPVLHVLDRGDGFRHIPALPGDLYAENGRGLYLICCLTEDFHISRRLGGGSHARAVLSWHFTFSRLRSAGFAAMRLADAVPEVT